MEWMEWVQLATDTRARRPHGATRLQDISAPSLTRYERGDCPQRERLEVWARELGLDVAVAVAAWRSRYEVGIIADCRAACPDAYWRRGRKGALGDLFVPRGSGRERVPLAVWQDLGWPGYAGRVGRGVVVRRETLAELLAVLLPVQR